MMVILFPRIFFFVKMGLFLILLIEGTGSINGEYIFILFLLDAKTEIVLT